MSTNLKAWNDSITVNDYHYVRLTFQDCSEGTNTPDVRFAIYSPYSGGSWVPIASMSDTMPFNTNHYITENLPTDATQGSATIYLTWQSTEGVQTPSNATIQGTYTVLQSPYNIDCLNPTTLYFPVYWNNVSHSWAIRDASDISLIDPCVDGRCVPCFSERTLIKLLKNVKPDVPVVIVRSFRWEKKMYRVNHPNLGEIEFTDEHTFFYNNNVYTFKELLKIHPDFKNNYTEVDLHEPNNGMHNYVYNFMIDPDHTKLDSMIKIDNNLRVMGLVPFEHFGHKLQKKLEIMCVLLNNKEIDLSNHMSNDLSNFFKGRENHYVYLSS